ncbi:MAG: hydantoinase B/oxoprolinase family protein [Candidatus Poribacteria bacterium]|nr:hydantoinase B/oxoprolinase family protein [Candidatus Poribacteria bacterium]
MTKTHSVKPDKQATYDVLKAEVHRKAMDEIAREMGITLVRTSGSPVVTEAKDLSCAVLDEKVEQIGFATYVGTHISTSFLGVEAVLRNYNLEDLAEGDAFVVNDPHTSGALHEGDVGVIMPYFYDAELVGWGYVNEHSLDIGGSGVSGFAASARDCFSEGLRFPGIRFMQKGKFNREWELFISNNVRAPSAVLNDMRSMVAAVNTGQRRLSALINRMGLKQHREFCEVNKGLSERLVRQRIAALPDGRYTSKDWIEFDGLGEAMLLELVCVMEVAGNELKLSFSGETQITGPVNGTLPVVLGQTMNTLQCVLLWDVPVNHGLWQPITIDVGPPGTVVNSTPPAPVSFAHVGAGMRIDKLVRDVLTQAISLSSDPAIRERACSQPCEGIFITTLSGVDNRTGHPVVIFPVSPTVGLGGPAQTLGDGQDTYSNTCNLGIGMAPVEVDESTTPVLILWRQIQASSGGAGISRGGNGMTTAFQITGIREMSGTVSNNGAEVPPRGAGGGWSGSTTQYQIRSQTKLAELVANGKLPQPDTLGGTVKDLPANTTVTVKEGDVFFVTNGGGGGLGDPLLRDATSVARDVVDGYVHQAVAQDVYGVVLSEAGEADHAATETRRSEIRQQRLGRAPSRPIHTQGNIEAGVGVRIHKDTWLCGYCEHELGSVSDNYRSSCLERKGIASETLSALGMYARARDLKRLVISDYFCPECGSCVRSDVSLENEIIVSAPEVSGVISEVH